MIACWISVAAYMGVIYLVSALPFRSELFERTQKFHIDWVVHVVEYSILGFLLARAFRRSMPSLRTGRLWIAVMAVGAFYAATDEWHQRSVPTRDASVYDAVADTFGVAWGAWTWMRRQKDSSTNNA